MITKKELEEICNKYGIDYEKLINANENVLKYGEYREICDTLDYLRDEIKIEPKNIEKCPSILYFSTNNIKDNWEFLKSKEITISNVENCLHVLNTVPKQMRETYQYVVDNYGVRYLNAITSILRVPVTRIKEIEEKFQNKFKPKNFLQAAYSRFSAEEIERIVKVCEAHNIEITGNVFKQSAEEIERIVKVCEEHKIEVTGSVFKQSAEEIEKNIEYIKGNYGEEFLKPLIISKSKKVLEETLPYLKEKGVLGIVKNSASILALKLSEIKERESFIEKIGETIVKPDGKAFNSIFGLSRKKYEERKKQYRLSGQDIGKASYGAKVEELAKLGISLEAKRRTGKEIAEASISSLADIEMTDREDNALTELVEKAKKEEKV